MLRAFGLAAVALAFTNSAGAQQRGTSMRLASVELQSQASAGSANHATTGSKSSATSDRPSRRSSTTAGPVATKMMPFTAQSPWLHGFGTRQPVFSGLYRFRPTNYKQALARNSYLRVHGAAARNRFWAKYQSGTPAAMAMPVAIHPVEREPELASARMPVSKIENGVMSPIHSIQMAVPRRLDLSQGRQPGPVRQAIQGEQTGPLFPLPKQPIAPQVPSRIGGNPNAR